MFGIGTTDAAFTAFEQDELQNLSPRKELDGRFIYLTRELPMPQGLANPVLCDFGSAVPLDDGREHREDIQPNAYRAPEVIIEAPWTDREAFLRLMRRMLQWEPEKHRSAKELI